MIIYSGSLVINFFNKLQDGTCLFESKYVYKSEFSVKD